MPRLRQSNFLAIVGRIYEAAEDPQVWTDVLRLLGVEFGSTVNVFVLSDKNSPSSAVVVSDGSDPKWEREYDDYYHTKNIVLPRLKPFLTPGRVLSSADHFRDGELLGSEYYQDFLRRRDVFYLIGGLVSGTPTSNALISLVRSRRRRPWSQAERDFLSGLMPHLQRAARLSGHFTAMRQERDQILNRYTMGVIVLNESGRVDFLNRAAEAIVGKRDGLCLGPTGIYAVDPFQASRLRKLVASAKLTASGRSTAGGGSMSVTQPSAGRPLSLWVAPMLPNATSPFSQGPRVTIFIGDPSAPQATNMERVAALFGLTPAESKLTRQLTNGNTVIEAARALGITQQTARVHLKRIFGKTATKRQSELIRVILNSPATLRD